MSKHTLRPVSLHDQTVDHVFVWFLSLSKLLYDVLTYIVDPFGNHLLVVGFAQQELVDGVLDGLLELLCSEDELVWVLLDHDL